MSYEKKRTVPNYGKDSPLINLEHASKKIKYS